MPAVSREHVSSLLNFIVQLASRIRVLESLGGVRGWRGECLTGEGSKGPCGGPRAGSCPPGYRAGAGWGARSKRGGVTSPPPPQDWGYLSDSRFQKQRQELGQGQ